MMQAQDMAKLHANLRTMSACMKHMTGDMRMNPKDARKRCVNMLRQNLKSKK